MYCELLLTANQRLAHYLQDKIPTTTTLLPCDTWLINLWQQYGDTKKILLSDFQEWSVWQEIISQTYETTSLVQQAWFRWHHWNLSLADINPHSTEETQAFIQWATEFQQQAQRHQWITFAELPQQLEQLPIKWPEKIILAGFDELSPALQQLFKAAPNTTTITHHPLPTIKANVQRLVCKEAEDELLTMARMVKQQLINHPQYRIGCVIPDLANRRNSVWHIFTQVFAVEELLPSDNVRPSIFNISAGQQLINYPLIKMGLDCLSLDPQKLQFSHFSHVIRSPYLNNALEDAACAATLDIKLREMNWPIFTAEMIDPILQELAIEYSAAAFVSRWRQWSTCYRRDHELSLSEWTTQFTQELNSLGWSCQQELDAHEQEILSRWQKLLTEEFIATDFNQRLYSRQAALKRLQAIAHFTLFQPKTAANVPIQILGSLEASGYEFDFLWITGLNDEQWPAPVNPNPFLPLDLQRRHNMPHASAKRQYQYTQQLQARLLNSAPVIFLSYCAQKKDLAMRPSRMITDFPLISVTDLTLADENNLAKKVWERRVLEKITDQTAPPLDPKEKIRGGSYILQHQSNCPFRAFAKIRLQANFPAIPSLGFSAAERGNLMHAVLDHIWKKIKSQQQLLNYSDTELHELVSTSTEKVLNQKFIESSVFKRTEKRRLIRLTKSWLDIEKNRPAFIVDQSETTQYVSLGELNLHIKIDRIDQLLDGSYFIIDYKSTINYSVQDWFNERLSDVQLPLYCAYGIDNAAGIAYAQVQNGRMKFVGLLNNPNQCFSAVTPYVDNWDSTKKNWQTLLKNLAADFSSGKAAVDPIDINSTCTHCDLQPLCRVQI